MAVENFVGDIVRAALDGALVITVNNRLARHLRQQVDNHMRALGSLAWRTPRIFTFESWLYQVAARLGLDDRILTPGQALHLWENVIDEELKGADIALMNSAEAAVQAQQAHHLLEQYEATFSFSEGGDDQCTFLRWRERWQDACCKKGLEDYSRLAQRVRKSLKSNHSAMPTEVIIAGFDDITPAVKGILADLQENGCRVRVWMSAVHRGNHHSRIGCLDIRDEVRCCARWVHRLLEEGSDGRIGIVAPELDVYKSLIERIFREELNASTLLPDDHKAKTFNLSLGSPLGEEGMIVAALEILSLKSSVTLDKIGFLLRSPFVWGYLAEQHSRGIFDGELRRLRLREIPLERLIRLAAGGFKKGCGRSDLFSRVLETVAVSLEEKSPRHPGAWAQHFAGMLEACRWPGDRTLDSRDYQVFTAWKELLETMASLDPVSKPISRTDALALLRRLAKRKMFQAEGSEGQVQVMGTLEVAGLEFDHLWVLGMHEEAFPPPPKPNPFLPIALQRHCGMPRADASRELDFAGKVAARLLKASPEVVISYPQKLDGQGVSISPLFDALQESEPMLAALQHPAGRICAQAPKLESRIDDLGVALPGGKKVSGGTAILKDQALCPFRAYARHRLNAEGLVTGALGLDALDRGSLVHDSLEFFWEQTRDLQTLQRLTEEALCKRVDECIEKALVKLALDRQVPIPRGLKNNEARRLAKLLSEWLEVEKQRADFTVECLETWHRTSLGQLTIQTRLDRIDRLADGSQIIIDYKTGQPGIADWLGERPLEPQLPLYSLDRDGQNLAAVAFAKVRNSNCAFIGVAREAELLPGIPALANNSALEAAGILDWKTLLADWRKHLLHLSNEFARGVAVVSPIDQGKACDRCDLQILCRINEQG